MAEKKSAVKKEAGQKTYFENIYAKDVVPSLKKKYGYKNVMQVPRLEKISINMGVGEAILDSKKINNAVADLTAIAGQKPIVTYSKKSVAGFKLRENIPIGCKVTLRKKKMYEFLERLAIISLPRVRDFKGLSGKSFDGKGNYSFGIKEQTIFAEISYDKIDQTRGMDITIVTTAKNDEEAKDLLKGFMLPFRN